MQHARIELKTSRNETTNNMTHSLYTSENMSDSGSRMAKVLRMGPNVWPGHLAIFAFIPPNGAPVF